jgi:hypothetical protein
MHVFISGCVVNQNSIHKIYLGLDMKIINTGVKLDANKKIKQILLSRGIIATPKIIGKGSMKGLIIIYQKSTEFIDGSNMSLFTQEIADNLNDLGFLNMDGSKIKTTDGEGGRFHIFCKYKKPV